MAKYRTLVPRNFPRCKHDWQSVTIDQPMVLELFGTDLKLRMKWHDLMRWCENCGVLEIPGTPTAPIVVRA